MFKQLFDAIELEAHHTLNARINAAMGREPANRGFIIEMLAFQACAGAAEEEVPMDRRRAMASVVAVVAAVRWGHITVEEGKRRVRRIREMCRDPLPLGRLLRMVEDAAR